MGGIHIQHFARTYPDQVSGLVLVDSAHELQVERIAGFRPALAEAEAQFAGLARLSATGLLALAPNQIPDRGLPEEHAASYRAVLASRHHLAGMREETAMMEQSLAAAYAAHDPDLGELPLRVLSRGQADPLPGMTSRDGEHYEQEWRRLQVQLAQRSTRSQHITAADSGHYIHLDQPKLVLETIRDLLRDMNSSEN